MESIYEYGSRAGVWRILREFERRALPLTVFGVAMALERNPEVTAAFVELGHEIACHGWRWIHYQNVDEATEREHMRIGVEIIRAADRAARRSAGTPVATARTRAGWSSSTAAFCTTPITTATTCRSGPTSTTADGATRPHLVVPYTLDTNDMRFATPQGFNTGEQFFAYLRDAFDVLYAEGDERPKMLSIGMHCRLLGRPGRFAGLQRFLDHVERHDRVWVCRRVDIARHWIARHPYVAAGARHDAPLPALGTAHLGSLRGARALQRRARRAHARLPVAGTARGERARARLDARSRA